MKKDENESTCPVFFHDTDRFCSGRKRTVDHTGLPPHGKAVVQKKPQKKTAQRVRIRQKIKIRSSKLPMKRHLKNFYRTVSMTAGVLEKR